MSKKTPESKIKALIRNDVDKLEEIVKNLKENTISYLYTNDCNIFDPSDANFTTKEARRMLKRLSSLKQQIEFKKHILNWDILNPTKKKTTRKTK